MGATTIWEHWDGIKPDGTMWSPGMNSFNHYAYGAIGEWMYRVMAGIETDEAAITGAAIRLDRAQRVVEDDGLCFRPGDGFMEAEAGSGTYRIVFEI